MKKYYMVVSENRMLANTKVHGITTFYYEFDLLDLLSVKFYVMLVGYIFKYFKFLYENYKIRRSAHKQRKQVKKALNHTAKYMPKYKYRSYNPYFNIEKRVEHDMDAPMLDTEIVIKTKIKRKNIKQNG